MRRKTAFFAFASLGVATAAEAQHISPLIYELAPSGAKARQEVVVGNSGSSPVAFEIAIARRTYTDAGTPVDMPESQAITVQPAALWVEPGSNRTVTVRYAGDAAIDRSVMYIVTFRQAPVRMAEAADGDGIKLQYEFSTIAHVVPENARPDIVMEMFGVSGNRARARIVNQGRRYARLDSGFLRISGSTHCVDMQGQALAEKIGTSWILPGEKRAVEFDLPSSCPQAGLQASWLPDSAQVAK